MFGAICGDVIGSYFERNNVKHKNFNLFSAKSRFTDDTVLTVAVADSIVNHRYFSSTIHRYSNLYPNAGYGSGFKKWFRSKHPHPYWSYGSGSAMRVSPVGFAFNSLEEVLEISRKTSEISHNHPEAVKGAQAVASSIFLARQGKDKQEIKKFIEDSFQYDLTKGIDEIRQYYKFDVSAQGSVPQAITAFLESTDYEDAVRNAISIGGDSDTIACMCGGIAEAYYNKIPQEIIDSVLSILPPNFTEVVKKFYSVYMQNSSIDFSSQNYPMQF